MYGIPIFDAKATDFSGNGIGLVFPTECTVEEIENSEYTLRMTLPLSADGRWQIATNGNIIKALCPVRENPEATVDLDDGETGEDVPIYSVNRAALAPLYKEPNAEATVLERLPRGTELVALDEIGDGDVYAHVSTVNGGMTGYVRRVQISTNPTRTETVRENGGTAVNLSYPRPQLFRIYSTSIDAAQEEVTVEAMHIFYDLRGNIIKEDYEASNVAASEAAQHCFGKLLNGHPFHLHAADLTGTVSGNYGWMNYVEALLDDQSGIIDQAGGQILRDNFDIWLSRKDENHVAKTRIQRGKNITGLQVNSDDSEVITRIIPCGKDKDGEELFLTPTRYVDSNAIDAYPIIRAQKIDYDISVGDDYKTEEAARTALRSAAEEDFRKGADIPAYGMEVDFAMLGGTGSENFRVLQRLHLGDMVTVVDDVLGLSGAIRMTEYIWDVLLEQYNSITLGDFNTAKFRYWGNAGVAGIGHSASRPLKPMAAATQDGCTASASSEKSAAWKAFDNNTSTYWRSNGNGAASWIQLGMDIALKSISVSVYSGKSRTCYKRSPTAGVIYGSNDGAAWTQIGSFSGWDAKKKTCLGTVECGNAESYSYVRLAVSAVNKNNTDVAIGYIVVSGETET